MSPLQRYFATIAIGIWRIIEDGWRADIRVGEDMLTTALLLGAKTHLSTAIALDGRATERTTGADLELWIGDVSTGYLGYCIQAKKMTRDGTYPKLNHNVGPIPQVTLLRTYALARHAEPLYMLFNHRDTASVSFADWQCGDTFAPELLGCSTTTSDQIQRVLARPRGHRNFRGLHRGISDTRPLQCLICHKACARFDARSAEVIQKLQPLPDDVMNLFGDRLSREGPSDASSPFATTSKDLLPAAIIERNPFYSRVICVLQAPWPLST